MESRWRLTLIAVLAVGAFGWGIPATVAGATGVRSFPQLVGTVHCRPNPAATTTEYLIGMVCPPAGVARAFGYQPVLVHTAAGWRYTRPTWAGGECNGPIGEEGPFWDFAVLCRVHDYGYDLVRLGIGDREEADLLLYADMSISCSDRRTVRTLGCGVLAGWARIVLGLGDALGFDPELRGAVGRRR